MRHFARSAFVRLRGTACPSSQIAATDAQLRRFYRFVDDHGFNDDTLWIVTKKLYGRRSSIATIGLKHCVSAFHLVRKLVWRPVHRRTIGGESCRSEDIA